MSALVFRSAHYEGSRLQHYPGDEVPPGMFSARNVDRGLDENYFVEVDDRRSLYRLFAPFSGAKEREPFTTQEIDQFCLPK